MEIRTLEQKIINLYCDMGEDMRKLASIRKVKEIVPIDGADQIENAKIDGWSCVVKKGVFQPGSLGVYFEIDSFLPVDMPQFEFLRKGGTKTIADGSVGYRIRTIKLRKTLSQGLFLPLKDFPNVFGNEGDDVTEIIGVKLYEPPIPANLRGEVEGLFPSFIRKTDQERVQNIPEYFETHSPYVFESSEKLDGTSTTIFYYNERFGVCSRNYELRNTEPKTAYWQIVEENNLQKKLTELKLNIALQGEMIGEGINKNPYKLKGRQIFIFDIYDIDKQEYMSAPKRRELVEKLGLNHVPYIEDIAAFERFNSVDDALQYVNRKSILCPSVPMEGVVFKSISGNIPYLSFKVLNNEVLLNEKDDY